MEQRLIWPSTHLEDPTPFTAGPHQRPLRLTFHSPSFSAARPSDTAAISLLNELSSEAELDIVDFEGAAHPAIVVDPKPSNGYRNITVRNPDGEPILHHIGISTSRISDSVLSSIFHIASDHQDFATAFHDLVAIEAHAALDRDIFVTSSPLLLSHRTSFPESNPMSPLEASQLAGLVFRTRNNWLFRHDRKVRAKTDRGMFYWVLMRTKLPAFWKYFSAALAARESHGERLGRIAQSILERCFRALQARDEIAVQFYLPQNNTTRDTMMYHFDYLTLLIAGAYDGMASVADIVYGLGIDQNDQSFRRERFVASLRRASLNDLANLATRAPTRTLMVMLHRLRNTIHSAGLGTLAYSDAGQPQRSYARVPPDFSDELLRAASDLGGSDLWGILREDFVVRGPDGSDRREYDVYIEPFSYAAQLVDQWLPLLDETAATTEVERLFPSGPPRDLLRETPPDWSDMVRFFPLLGR